MLYFLLTLLTADSKLETLEMTDRPHDVTLQVGMEIFQMCGSNQLSANIQWWKDGEELPLGECDLINVLTLFYQMESEVI